MEIKKIKNKITATEMKEIERHSSRVETKDESKTKTNIVTRLGIDTTIVRWGIWYERTITLRSNHNKILMAIKSFVPNASFSTPWKHQKTVNFLGGRERVH